jgi:predicted chitinase
MLTAEHLKSIMPRLTEQRRGELLPFLSSAMTEFAIQTPARAAAFLAQLAHESGQFRFMEEIWGPTDAQRRYEPETKLSQALGNSEAGDGKRFKGRGPIQLTGRANYRRFGDLLNTDLVGDPARAANPDVAFRVAGLFWSKKGLNELADLATAEAFKEITRRINGGYNGLADRQAFYAVARTALGVADVPVSRGGPPAIPADEPVFDRGSEAIRTLAPPRARAKKKKSSRKTSRKVAPSRTKTASRKKTTSRRTAARRKPAGKKKTASRTKARR